MDELSKRFGEASSWAGLAAAMWGGTALLPQYLAGGLGIDEPGWRAIGVFAAVLATILAIAMPEARRQERGARSRDDA
jgi:hypothetical protein